MNIEYLIVNQMEEYEEEGRETKIFIFYYLGSTFSRHLE